ncbi:unnamed protein product [Oncorhynchus mykiss]|uniref:RIMS-binding protein 2 n=1 Tax=Oncorhynchus mykiss TaxID=8022 RepID=A0A060WNA0_ONCMY|nr:unnamed protein product [Oncorhynchus mykiss]
MREAAERRQQLDEEHEQALAALTSKQQKIHLLHKAQVEAEREHEGAVRLLEDKVRDLEQKCRSQTKQFGHLSKSLEDFRLEADTVDIFSTDSFSKQKTPLSLENKLSQILNGLAVKAGKVYMHHIWHLFQTVYLINQDQRTIRDRPELLSVNPTTVTTSCPSSPQRATPSEMEDEVSPAPRSKPRYTGTVRLCTARYSYNPYDGPNEHPEAELPLVAGKYLYVYGTMDDDGFYQGELLDGQRGLVPSNFVEFVQDKEKPSIQLGDGDEDLGSLDHITLGLMGVDGGAPRDGLLGSSNPLGPCSNGTGPLDPEDLVDDIVPYPRRITLIKQLARSVIVAWEPPIVPLGWGKISCYNVLVDGEVRASVPYGDRTKSLLEKLDLDTYTHRVSVQSVTDRGLSDELRCTLMVGANVVVAPYGLRVDDILRDSAELSWLPSNSNYGHTVFLDGAEHAVVKPGRYRLRFVNLKAMTVYKVRVVARPHQVPWQLLMEQREKKEAAVEFCTQAAGPPLPPQEVQVQCGQAPGVLQVRWKPPILSPSGTSNGASVIGYAVCTKGQKIAEVLYPLADYVTVELNRIQCLEAREVIVRTLSAQGESQDSHVAPIPNNLLLPPPHPAPHRLPLLPHPPPQLHQRPVSARDLEAKEQVVQHGGQPWDPTRSPSAQPPPAPMYGHTLEAPRSANHRSPSPQRILPQPRGTPIPDQMAKAIAREAAQRVAAESGRMERRVVYNEQGQAFHQQNSDEEEEDEEGYGHGLRRQGASVDEFLRGSELGRPVKTECNRVHIHIQWFFPGAGYPTQSIVYHIKIPVLGSPLYFRNVKCQNNSRENYLFQLLFLSSHSQCVGLLARTRFFSSAHKFSVGLRSGLCDGHSNTLALLSLIHFATTLEVCLGILLFPTNRSLWPNSYIFVSSDQRTFLQKVQSLSPCAVANRSLDFLWRFWSSVFFLAEQPFRLCRYRACFNVDIDTFVLVSSSIFTRSFAETERLSFMSDMTAAWSHSVYTCVLLFVQMNVVPSGVWKFLPRMNQTCGGLPFFSEVLADLFRLFHDVKQRGTEFEEGYRDRERSPPNYDESEPEESFRIFVALFDYDPLSMSPNPDAADEELPFKEGQIIRVYGDKDTDGFYRGEIRGGRMGLLPCNMVSEIRAEDEETMDQLIKQGFLPLNTPVDKVGIGQDRRGLCQHQATRRMVALYDYDPRESSPNVDVEAELTFCAGDILAVFGEIDEDGFYYGEINGHRGLVPSNFLEEVPDDVEVYLTDTPSRYAQDEPANRAEAKRKKIVHFTS